MSNTAQILQSMSDDAAFENLVTSVLRKHSSGYEGIVHTGISVEGKPIASALDGFCLVPHSDPPHFLLVEHTTTKQARLERKWLHDHTTVRIRKSPEERKSKLPSESDDGDLLKAGREAKKLRRHYPDAVFTVILATNKTVPLDLAQKVYVKAAELGVTVDFWAQCRITDFLDHAPEGQYLRQEFLGIRVNRLSESLLRRIAYSSLEHHRRRFSMRDSCSREEIVRDIQPHLIDVIKEPGSALIGLRGASGTGKSTLLRQVGREICAKGGIALWVPAEHIESGTSLDYLLLQVLRRFCSSLDTHAGEEVIRLASLLPEAIVLLVDDVNRLPSPEKTMHTIEVWHTLLGEDEASYTRSHPKFCFVVPLWTSQPMIGDQASKSGGHSRWEYVELHSYSLPEREHLAITLSENTWEARHTIDILNGDPFLCGLLPDDIEIPADISRSNLIEMAFERALSDAAQAAVNSSSITATQNEFIRAVDKLVELIVKGENPEPQWDYVRDELGNRTADLLHKLGRVNRLGWIAPREGGEVWRWKHDRLRDALIGRWLAQRISCEKTETWFSNPGFAEASALCLVFEPNLDEQRKALTTIAKFQPLAVAEMLRLTLFPSELGLRQLIAESLAQTLSGFDERVRGFVRSPEWFILNKLAQTDDSIVLQITQDLSPGRLVWAARFRNGDISAGLEWMSLESQREFLPAWSFPFLEQSIEAFGRLHDSRRDFVADKLIQAIEDPERSTAAITMAGYLAWPELCRPIWNAWNLLPHERKLETLAPIVWALSRSGDNPIQVQLEDALLLVREVSNEEREEGKSSDRYRQFMSPLWMSRRWPFTTESAQTWAKVAAEYADLSQTMCFVLRGIDYPSTMERYVRWSAERGGSLWDDAFEPSDPVSEYSNVSVTPSSLVTREHLWRMVEHEPDLTTRKIAFNFWKRRATLTDLEQLRSISSEDQLFDDALKVRLLLRDKTAADSLVRLIDSGFTRWLRFAPLAYEQPGVEHAFLDNLENGLRESLFWISSTPSHLPAQGMRTLLREKRGVLSEYSEIWPSLWRSDVPEALQFVQEAVKAANPEDLEYFFSGDGFPYPISRRMLGALVPILDCFPRKEKERLADLAVRGGFVNWTRNHLYEVVSEIDHWLTDEKAFNILEETASLVPQGANVVLKSGNVFRLKLRIEDGYYALVTDMIGLLKKWLGSKPNENQTIVAAMLLASLGDGGHIAWWRDFESSEGEAHTVWFNTLYILRRTQWHN